MARPFWSCHMTPVLWEGYVGGENYWNEICISGSINIRLSLCGEPCIWNEGLPVETPVVRWVEGCRVQSLWCVGRWKSAVCIAESGWGCVQLRQFVHWWLDSEGFRLQSRGHRVAICGKEYRGCIWCLYQWRRSHILGCGQTAATVDVLYWFYDRCVS